MAQVGSDHLVLGPAIGSSESPVADTSSTLAVPLVGALDAPLQAGGLIRRAGAVLPLPSLLADTFAAFACPVAAAHVSRGTSGAGGAVALAEFTRGDTGFALALSTLAASSSIADEGSV